MELDLAVRHRAVDSVVGCLNGLPQVLSITFVGSFMDSQRIYSVSDIDVVVIVDHLTEAVFTEVVRRVSCLTGADCGLPGYRTRLNLTFGPLKFDDPETAVFHLMVYDVAGHRKHVADSPFTCYDWERHPPAYGCSLSDVCTAAPLQLSDLMGCRRSLSSYLADLEGGAISYRQYRFENGLPCEEKLSFPMNARHRGEYAYHVMRYLLLNLLKILRQDNPLLSDRELAQAFLQLIPLSAEHLLFFAELSAWKRDNGVEPAQMPQRMERFLQELESCLRELSQETCRVVFLRHAKTACNDGTFLGIGRDPGILPGQLPPQLPEFARLFTGTLRRTIETAGLFTALPAQQDIRLNEINYAAAEGLDYGQLRERYPEIAADWLRGGDAPFPGGECQQDVARRLAMFIRQELIHAAADGNTAVVTHNVVLRSWLGLALKAPVRLWHKFQPGHLEPLPCRIRNGVLIPELSLEQRMRFRLQIALSLPEA